MVRVVRGVGWTLVSAGVVVLLYVVYLLWFTGLETDRQQASLADDFAAVVDLPAAEQQEEDEAVELGDAYAALWFERDGELLFADDPYYVVEGTGLDDLKRGPGHYPDSAAPGEDGNLAIAGHRTTYGAPFNQLAELRDGDTIHVQDRDGVEWIYAFREQRIVDPGDYWVVSEPDPIDLDAPTMTLTTCHPMWSAAQRLIAFGELVGPA